MRFDIAPKILAQLTGNSDRGYNRHCATACAKAKESARSNAESRRKSSKCTRGSLTSFHGTLIFAQNTILRSQASMRTTIETGLFGADPHALRPTTLASGDSIPGIKRTKNPFADPPLAKTYDMLFGRPRSPTLADTRVYESRDPFMDPPEIRMDVSERRTGGATVRI